MLNTMKKILLAICLLSYEVVLGASLENTRFNHISTQHGLSQKTVQAIYQDSVGFMWFGTQEGLNRYDGKELRVYRYNAKNPNSIAHDVIRAIQEDAQGVLWIATSGGLSQYRPSTDDFKSLPLKDADKDVLRFNTLFLDSLGTLWIGSDGNGIFHISYQSGEPRIEKFQDIEPLNSADIRAITEDSRGRIWIGTNEQGVFLYSKNNLEHFTANGQPGSVSHNSIRGLWEDSRGRIWIATRGGGLNKYDQLNRQFVVFRHSPDNPRSLTHDRVYKIFEDSKARLWIATDGGLNLFDSSNNDFTRIQHKSSQQAALNHNRVLSIFEDHGGLLWFGTLAGINIWNPNLAIFNHYRNIPEDEYSLINNTVYALAQRNENEIAIGTFGSGINILNLETDEIRPLNLELQNATHAQRIISLMVDNKQNLWAGSLSKGVEVFSSDLKLVAQYSHDPGQPESLSANGITDILQDSDGEIWIATYRSGINLLNKSTGLFKRFNLSENGDGLISENVYAIAEDDEGYLWLATDGGGISRLDKHTGAIKTFLNNPEDESSLSGNIASSIFHDSKGRIWIGTFGYGLNLWQPSDRRKGLNRFKRYSVESGLLSSTINGVTEDDEGYIWISTVKGVSRLNPETDEFSHYNLSDEIHNNELNHGAILKSHNGRLFFGGLNGVSSFIPSQVQKNNHVPNVVLTQVLYENEPVEFDKATYDLTKVELSHKDYLVAFEFAALDYSNPTKNQYQYKLEGFDSHWISSNNRSRATFTNLPAGKYVFKVKGSNNDGVWSDEKVNLEVIVHPAPWLTWWAYSIYAAVFCILLILFIRHQARRFASQDLFQKQVLEKVSEKTELYLKTSEAMKEQIEQLKSFSYIDDETELPSQNAILEQLKLTLKLMRKLSDESQEHDKSLFSFIVDVQMSSSDTNNPAEVLINLAEIIKSEVELVARWNQCQLAGFVILNSESNPYEFGNNLTEKLCRSISSELDNVKISLGYILPLHDNTSSPIDADSIMMLTEHTAHYARGLSGHCFVGIDKIYQPLTTSILKQTLLTQDISTLESFYSVSKKENVGSNVTD